MTGSGQVVLVGAGPGDPDLITLRAIQVLSRADVVLYDRLIPRELLDWIPPDAQRLPVGKARDHHTVPQSEINRRLVEFAREGLRVVRLKGGDPFTFARGGEEIEGLLEAGIPFQVVPGVTAAQGCAAYAGIPITHRDYAQSARYLTGHRQNGVLDLGIYAPFRTDETLVIYMGLLNLPEICAQLRTHGLPDDHPAAIVQEGTTPAQRIVTADLATLPEAAADAGIAGPALILVSPTVRLHDRLGWYAGDPDASSRFPDYSARHRAPSRPPDAKGGDGA